MRGCRNLILVLALVGATTGCIPVRHTLQPGITVTVADANGQPLAGAVVQLGKYSSPFDIFESTRDFSTDASGTASIERQAKWGWIILAPDGVGSYYFHLCVAKPGYEPAVVHARDLKRQVAVMLQPSSGQFKCAWSSRPRGQGPQITPAEVG